MIYGKMFDGDDNEVAMTLQAHIYWDFGVVRLYAIAGRRPRPEDPGRNLHSLPGRRHWREGTFDHRSLQWAHDLVEKAGGVLGWLANTALSAVVGLVWGAAAVVVMHLVPRRSPAH